MTVPPSYWIPQDTYVCTVPEGAIFLDAKLNKYFGISSLEAKALRTIVGNWPKTAVPHSDDTTALDETEVQRIAETFVDSGLLARTLPIEGRYQTAVVDLDCVLCASESGIDTNSPVHLGHIWTFASAFASSRFSLRFRPFLSIVRGVQLRKEASSETKEAIELARLVAIFSNIRPYFFSANGQCLLHALTLVTFLSRYGFFPNWVIGVRSSPWGAHSWVQQGRMILDSTPEKIWDFTPIMII